VPGATTIRVLGALLILWGGYRLYVMISSMWLDEEAVEFLAINGVLGLSTIVAGVLLVRLHRAGRVFGLWVCSVILAFEVLAFGSMAVIVNFDKVPAQSLGLQFWLLQPLEIVLFLVGIILIARWHPPREIERLGRIFD
jgi:hypothetical protein